MARSVLPIDSYLDQICLLVIRHQVVIIAAETGAGKTTRVPIKLLSLLTDPDERVIAAMPRRIAASEAAKRVADEEEDILGGLVGYQTAFDRAMSSETRLLYCTDQIQLIKEIAGNGDCVILVIDEIHEHNWRQEMLLAWVKKQIGMGAVFKVVIMSATADTERLSAFFDNAPVINVPGRTFPVVRRHIETTSTGILPAVINEAELSLRQDKNTLVFVPGLGEIETVVESLSTRLEGKAQVVALYADQTPAEQALAFAQDGLICVVATNIGETSLTIPGMDAVIDTGQVRIVLLENNIETLVTQNAPQDSLDQRAGRVGRTKPGTYTLCSHLPYEMRPKHQIPEIQRVSLGQPVLMLAMVDESPASLEFYHKPPQNGLAAAAFRLRMLGAMTPHGEVTDLGREMARIPLDVSVAAMVIEARKRNVLAEVLTIAACIEAKSVRARKNSDWVALLKTNLGSRVVQSDLLAELDCYERALEMTDENRLLAGIHLKRFSRAQEIREHLVRKLDLPVEVLLGGSTNRNEVVKACMVGFVDMIYRPIQTQKSQTGKKLEVKKQFSNGSGHPRILSRDSQVSPDNDFVVGIPFSFEAPQTSGDTKMLHLLLFVSALPKAWLPEIMPTYLVSRAYHNRLADPARFRPPGSSSLSTRRSKKSKKHVA